MMGVRPPLPYRCANPFIKDHLSAPQLPVVKYQILNCQGKDILVGRLKIDTPTDAGHAFILRRYDTGAISLTTMFRAAFPNTTEAEEKQEIQWVKDNFNLCGNNGSSKDPHITRLAGTWVDPQLAIELGKAYSLGALISTVVDAAPDPNGSYRRSGKNGTTTTSAAPPITASTSTTTTAAVQNSTIVVSKPPSAAAAKTLPTPSPTSVNPPAKRRKEGSPAPSQIAATTSTSSSSSTNKPPSRASPSPSKTTSVIAGTRRSTRMSKSPGSRVVAGSLTSARTPKRGTKKDQASIIPGSSSELPVVDEEGQMVEDGVAGTELMEEDIKEQKNLIKELKKMKDNATVAVASSSSHAQDTNMDESDHASTSSSKKRDREEEDQPLKFEFKEPEMQERAIATNRRVSRFTLEPRTKSFAWGVAAFAVGMGAITFLPSLF